MQVLIGPSNFGEEDPSPINLLTDAGLKIIPNPYRRKLTKSEVLELLPGNVGIIAGLECVDREVLSATGLRVVSRCGSGMANVDLDAASELGIEVFSTPEGPTQAVAELTVGMMLCLLRGVVTMNANLQAGKWNKYTGFQLKGKTILIIGYGRIGRRVASLLAPFDIRILVCDPFTDISDSEYETVALDDGIPRADIIALHASGEYILLGKRELGLLKEGVFILNAARGSLIDEDALLHHLNTGSIAGCWLDTFEQEPYHGSLRGLENVILTPHVGSYTREGRLKMEMEAATNLLKGLELS